MVSSPGVIARGSEGAERENVYRYRTGVRSTDSRLLRARDTRLSPSRLPRRRRLAREKDDGPARRRGEARRGEGGRNAPATVPAAKSSAGLIAGLAALAASASAATGADMQKANPGLDVTTEETQSESSAQGGSSRLWILLSRHCPLSGNAAGRETGRRRHSWGARTGEEMELQIAPTQDICRRPAATQVRSEAVRPETLWYVAPRRGKRGRESARVSSRERKGRGLLLGRHVPSCFVSRSD